MGGGNKWFIFQRTILNIFAYKLFHLQYRGHLSKCIIFFHVFTLTVMIQKENLFDFSRKKHDNFVKLILDLL